MDFVWIEPGAFLMGTPEEQMRLLRDSELWDGAFEDEVPAHQVTITQGFWLAKCEISQAQWEAVMATAPWVGQGYVEAAPQNPAVHISWDDVQQLIGRLNATAGEEAYRLPTEAEWEHACRAGTATLWSFGDDQLQLPAYSWYDESDGQLSLRHAQPVGTKLPNAWGLYDMHANVWEWCQDRFEYFTGEATTDPTGAQSGLFRVIRGGCWLSEGEHSRSANRGLGPPDRRDPYTGARLAMTGPVPTAVSPHAWGQIKTEGR